MLCDGRRLSQGRRGKRIILASKVFARIWRDRETRWRYMDICLSMGFTYSKCRDNGVFYVRSAIVRLMKNGDSWVAEALRRMSLGLRPEVPPEACRD